MKYLSTLFFALLCIYSVVFALPFTPEEQIQAAESGRHERQAAGADHHEAVDFGAHTGDHGAFGWYADFPVHTHSD